MKLLDANIVAFLSTISSTVNIYSHIKDLVESSKNDVNNSNWSTYINSQFGFKLSWPSPRWCLNEVQFFIIPNVN